MKLTPVPVPLHPAFMSYMSSWWVFALVDKLQGNLLALSNVYTWRNDGSTAEK